MSLGAVGKGHVRRWRCRETSARLGPNWGTPSMGLIGARGATDNRPDGPANSPLATVTRHQNARGWCRRRSWTVPQSRLFQRHVILAKLILDASGDIELVHVDINAMRRLEQIAAANGALRCIHRGHFEAVPSAKIIFHTSRDMVLNHARCENIEVNVT